MHSRFSPAVREILGPSVAREPSAEDALARWLADIATWNRRIDLTAARDDRELVGLMIADAAVLAQHIADGATVIDVGTGAGAPGLALAALRPDLLVTLVEPMQKRVAFLRSVIGGWRRAGIERRIELVHGRGEDATCTVEAAVGVPFDVAISRATLAPPAWLELGVRLAPEVWVLLARESPPALEGTEITAKLEYILPLTGAPRCAVRYRRSGR